MIKHIKKLKTRNCHDQTTGDDGYVVPGYVGSGAALKGYRAVI